MLRLGAMAPTAKIPMGKGVLVLTYGCNLRCSFCYAGVEVFEAHSRSMRYEEACKGIDFMAMLGIRTYTLLGGEPTVHRDILKVVSYSAERGIGPWVVTNGLRIAKEEFGQKLVDAGLKGGCISVHGHTPEEHDTATRVPGSYVRVTRAIRNAVENGWPLYPMLTVMENNLPSVMGVVENLMELGCKTIYINYGVPNIVPELDTGVASGPEALAKLSEDLFHLQGELGVRFIFNREKNKVPLCHFDYDTLKDMFADDVIGTGCEAVEGNTIVIEPGGTVLGCSHWVDHPVVNIFRDHETLELFSEDEFWEQWHSGAAAAYRHDLRYFPYDKCEGCGWREAKMCFGGCKVWQSAGVLPKRLAFDGDGVTRYTEPAGTALPMASAELPMYAGG